MRQLYIFSKQTFYYILSACLLLATAAAVNAHEGVFDDDGCHYDESTDKQHCHLDDVTPEIFMEVCNFDNDRKYQKSEFKSKRYKHWLDEDKNGLNTLEELLTLSAEVQVTYEHKRRSKKKRTVASGIWYDPYTDLIIDNPAEMDVEHLVPLEEAHRSGAWQWRAKRRKQYANDLANDATLVVVSLDGNEGKRDKDPAQWLPPNKEYHCQYVSDWMDVKDTWGLCYDEAEIAAIQEIKLTCSDK